MPLVPETRHRGGENTEDRFGRVSVGHRTRGPCGTRHSLGRRRTGSRKTRHRGGENTEDLWDASRSAIDRGARDRQRTVVRDPRVDSGRDRSDLAVHFQILRHREGEEDLFERVSIGHRSRRSRSSADRGSRSTSRFRSGSIRPRGALPDRAPQRRGGHRGSFLSASRSAIERRARDHHRRPLSDETEVRNPFGNATCSSRSIQTRPKDPLCPPLLCGAFSGSEPSSAIAHAHAEPEPTPACGSKSKIAGKRDQRYDVQRT